MDPERHQQPMVSEEAAHESVLKLGNVRRDVKKLLNWIVSQIAKRDFQPVLSVGLPTA